MNHTYPKPATPLPWRSGQSSTVVNQGGGMVVATFHAGDAPYIVRAANAFPHLVAALEALLGDIQNADLADNAEHALAIARGETPP